MNPCIDAVAAVSAFFFLCQPLRHFAVSVSKDKTAVIWMAVRMCQNRCNTTFFLVISKHSVNINIKNNISI